MEFRIEQTSSIERKLSFTVSSNKVASELDKAFNKLTRTARLRGFRPGKVPRRVVEQRFGANVKDEVAQSLINTSFQEAAKDIEFFGRPTVDERGEISRSADFTFSVKVEVRPELELNTYTGVTVDYPVIKVQDAQVDAEVSRLLQAKASLSEIEDRAVQHGDLVLAELTVSDGDEVVHQHPGTMVNTAEETYYKGVESVLLGGELNGEVEGEVTFAEDAQVEELAGRTLQVKAKVLSINAMKAPELSDELAEELGYEGGSAGMRAAVTAKLEESLNANSRNQARANLLRALIDDNDFEAPRALVDQQLNALMEEIRIQRAYRGEDVRKVRFTDAQMADYRSRARFAAKASLILDHVATAEKIGVNDEEIEAKYQEIADARGQAVEAIKGYFIKEDAVDELRDRLLEEKTLDWLLESAELNEVEPGQDNDEAAVAADDAAQAAPVDGGEE